MIRYFVTLNFGHMFFWNLLQSLGTPLYQGSSNGSKTKRYAAIILPCNHMTYNTDKGPNQ